MKRDINLMPLNVKRPRYALMIITLALVLLIIMAAFLLPILYKNRLISESEKLDQELRVWNEINNEYLNLKEYSDSLSKKVDIIYQIESRNMDFVSVLDTIDESIFPGIELTHISLSDETLDIEGIAPSKATIANSILRLYENKRIVSVNIHEISLDRENEKQRFFLRSAIEMNDICIEDIYTEGEEDIEDFK